MRERNQFQNIRIQYSIVRDNILFSFLSTAWLLKDQFLVTDDKIASPSQ